MADQRSLVHVSGRITQVADADSLLVGAGIKTASGNLTLTPAGTDVVLATGKNLTVGGDIKIVGDLTRSTAGALNVGADANSTSVAVGHSGITTTITGGLTQLTGAVSLSGNAASSLTTSAGALTLTSAAAATWSTAAGALSLNGAGGVNLQTAGSTRLAVADAALTVQAGVVLGATGSGNINLPNNGSARFQVEGSAVGATVTATNLNTLTNGSNADALHIHTGIEASSVVIAGTSGEALDAGEVVVFDDSAGNPRVFKADADGAGELKDAIGIVQNTVGASGSAVDVQLAGEISVADAEWDSVPAVTDVGKRAYLSTTSGNLTLTAPTAAGTTAIRVGWVTRGGTGQVKLAVLVGEGMLN